MSHEIGHYQNALNVGFDKFVRSGGVRFTPAQRTTVAKEVSTYGSTSPREMVAEVFAGHRDGKTYSDKIEGMYSTMFHKGKL